MKSYSKSYRRLVVGVVLVIAWMAFIFYMSSRVADDSDAMSDGLITIMLNLLFGNADPLLIDQLSHPVRKLSHFTEYTVLGILLANAAHSALCFAEERRGGAGNEKAVLPGGRHGLISWFIGTLYAASDEFHQGFVPGRSPQITDVLIDSSGVVLGVLLFFLAVRLLAKR